jgi:hypothetical protein
MIRLIHLVTLALVALVLFAAPSGWAQPAPPAQPAQPAAGLVAPTLLSDPTVPYPKGATGEATVLLTIAVNVDGTVRSATPAEINEPFSGAAAKAALTWRFEPATRDGKPTGARIRFEVIFHPPAPALTEPPLPTEPSTSTPSWPTTPKPSPDKAAEVRVRGARAESSRTATLSRTEVRQIPGAFGDPFRAIEIMPGVTPIISGLPFFFIRGAPPGDVGYYLDGIRVPYLFHVGVGPSVVHPALIDRVDLYPGGYPARFGRFSGGIVSGETTPNATELHGEYNVRLFDAGALVESPFGPEDRGNILLGGRYSYTALLLTLVNPSTVLDYWDYQGRVSYDLGPRDRVGLFGFGAYDLLGQKTDTGDVNTLFGTEFHRLDARYDHKIDQDSTMRTAVTGGIDLTQAPGNRYLRDRLVGTRTEVTYRVSEVATVRAGADMQVDTYNIELNTAALTTSQQQTANTLFPTRTDLASGVRGDVVLQAGPRLEITPGARFDYFASEGATAVAVDPRLGTKTTLTDRLRLLGALGIAHQPPAFVIPLPGFQPGGLKGGLQMAVQESMGIEYDVAPGTTATATVFHNGFFNMSDALSVMQPDLSGCPPGSFPSDTLGPDPERQPVNPRSCGQNRVKQAGTILGDQMNADAGNTATALETRSHGTAYGFELFIKRKLTSRLGGFLSYTLSRSTRTANGQTFIATFDRTHVLNTALAYDLGRNWRAGTRVTFYTGLPKAPDPTDPGSTRLDPFFRLDLRLEKRWQLSKRWWISFVAEWMNATLSKESVGTSCTLNGCQDTKIGPVTIPSIGVEGGF